MGKPTHVADRADGQAGRPGPVLLERERELSAIEDALVEAAAGRGSVVAIEGEPGIGKSELLRAAAGLAAARSIGSHQARGSETERSFGNGLVRALTEHVLRGVDGSTRGRLLAGPAEQLRALLDPRAAPPAELAVARGFQGLVENCAARTPLLVGVDDAHWADARSLRVLLYLAHRIEWLGVVLCLATRPPAGSQAPFVDALLVEARDRLLRPAALSPAAAAVLVSRMLGAGAEPAFCSACHEATGGNPLLLRELGRGLASDAVAPVAANRAGILEVGGAAVSRTVRLRLAHLPDAATRLAQAAAVLGEGAPIAQAAAVAGLDPRVAFEAAGGLGQLEILSGGDEVEFVHPLIREGLLAELGRADAAALHEAAARLLAEAGAAPQRVARHLLQAPPRGSEATVRALRKAASAAFASGESATARELLARALQEPAPHGERPALLLELAAAEHLIDHAAAKSHAEAALELIREPDERAAAALQLAEMLPVIDPRGAIEVIEPLIDQLSEPQATVRARAVMLTGALLAPDRLSLARELAELLRPEPNADTIPARMAASLVGYLDALDNKPASDVASAIERAALPLDPPEVLGALSLGMMALIAADSPATVAIAEEWLAIADRTGLAGETTGALMARSHALLARGRLDEALADARAGLEIAELYVGGAARGWLAAALADALIELGELDEAERHIGRHAPAGGAEWTFDLHGLLLCRARLAGARGDGRAALERMLELGRLCEQAGVRNPALAPWRSRAALLLGTAPADGARARRLAGEEVELARAWGAPRALGRALSALATVSQGDEARALHEQAVAILGDCLAPHELARAQLALGSDLRRRGKRAAAREPLRGAIELAEACGAAPVAARARDELVAAGARPRRTALSGIDGLTRRERDVAALAARGHSNTEIAERLFVTARTVESHLSNAYRKLDISSRSQLADALRR